LNPQDNDNLLPPEPPPPPVVLWFGSAIDPASGLRFPAKVLEGEDRKLGVIFLPAGWPIRQASGVRLADMDPPPPKGLAQRLQDAGLTREEPLAFPSTPKRAKEPTSAPQGGAGEGECGTLGQDGEKPQGTQRNAVSEKTTGTGWSISFFVPGVPVAKGSARAYVVKGRAVVTQDNRERQRPWASLISYAAQEATRGWARRPGRESAVRLTLVFTMPRPKGHRTPKGVLRKSAPRYHVKTPDCDKLVRLVLDSLTGFLYTDDAQVVQVFAVKQYEESEGRGPGCAIEARIEEVIS
jgi:Holliday junction resolvase RusA-like endonuclease